jgi:hypothetical protein
VRQRLSWPKTETTIVATAGDSAKNGSFLVKGCLSASCLFLVVHVLPMLYLIASMLVTWPVCQQLDICSWELKKWEDGRKITTFVIDDGFQFVPWLCLACAITPLTLGIYLAKRNWSSAELRNPHFMDFPYIEDNPSAILACLQACLQGHRQRVIIPFVSYRESRQSLLSRAFLVGMFLLPCCLWAGSWLAGQLGEGVLGAGPTLPRLGLLCLSLLLPTMLLIKGLRSMASMGQINDRLLIDCGTRMLQQVDLGDPTAARPIPLLDFSQIDHVRLHDEVWDTGNHRCCEMSIVPKGQQAPLRVFRSAIRTDCPTAARALSAILQVDVRETKEIVKSIQPD